MVSMKGTCACGQVPSFDQLWLERIQEETRKLASTSKEKEEELVLELERGQESGTRARKVSSQSKIQRSRRINPSSNGSIVAS